MSDLIFINTALCLPFPDVEALLQGRTIAAIPQTFIQPGRSFALYPSATSINLLTDEQHYKSNFLIVIQNVYTQLSSETVWIKAWAKCELCQILDNSESLEALSQLTIWQKKALQQILLQRQYIFIAHLRVYLLSNPIGIPVNPQGQFMGLPNPVRASTTLPVLGDRIFAQRKHQLENRQPPLHPELEELQSALASLGITNPAAKELDDDIKIFFGWSSNKLINEPDPDLAWIKDIAKLGNRSKQEDEGKNNYQAGTDFENVVRDSLDFLGFTVDRTHKGGAGGLDLFCSQPYPLFGECKAGKKIPNDTAVQLLNLGSLHRLDVFNQAVKLIIGPGEPTNQLKDAATVHRMAIINPETLEKLVKLQKNYRNSVDLFKLKEYLKPGQSDEEVEKYIDQIYASINLRSQIIKTVKELSEQDNQSLESILQRFTVTEIRVHYNVTHNPKLTDEGVHDLLIELSSPLTGYLGRIKGNDWRSDHFYFLHDLLISPR
ncbi:DUF1802 family protein [Dendronalium sp. ChiSLP03b]|uniref:DUF1802 family protein n=1 Tax=Dendronalium sp. ChiSLP03b TaxID=3075381 RepID=UPI002AD2E1D8|nr:DUF1802 family protein [Dendronalium sp. ChiSLP03b]MDZ8206365.1 DUF1802 family protein [Dendronalium sp. ChiSLP03b]